MRIGSHIVDKVIDIYTDQNMFVGYDDDVSIIEHGVRVRELTDKFTCLKDQYYPKFRRRLLQIKLKFDYCK